MSEILKIESISQLHKMIGYEEPKHPLISVMDVSKIKQNDDFIGQKFSSSMYTVMLKDKNCGIQYGRNYYDFEEGVLAFTSPGQVITATENPENPTGWMLFFHADLIRKSNLGKIIGNYTFFSYDIHEALHLSKKEEGILNDCIEKIEFELDQNIDSHSQKLLVSNIDLLLNYCNRFYERQFHTRSVHHKDVVTNIESIIKTYYDASLQIEQGTPTIQYLAERVNLSANYLSDLLRKETGKNAKEHINSFVINKAKNMLLNSERNVSEIAYDLGFNYPHYFSRMFKQKTGITPAKYRELNLN